ncbi:ester cyclase [uncultured Chitinophaga sp.]|jgi:Predicted ester cyclase|uniref:ester cyclase n=1 Tax=uncultured Chitinophaga sp. TaxID=339340 RepID=UPI002608646E|nr:ester cyclase [uncultured Chitinophaga sp.]
MTEQEKNKAVVTRFNKDFIEKGDLQAFDEIVATDFVNRSAFAIGASPGREGVRDYITDVLHKALSDINVEIFEQIAEGDTVVSRKAITGVQTGEFMGQPASGKKIAMHMIDIVKLKNGQYTEHWRYGQVISNAE